MATRSSMDVRLCFFSLSADKPPGEGSREAVADESVYTDLLSVRDWRRVLSNFYHTQAPIPCFHRTFRSVEHAYQYAKLRLADPETAESLTLESGSTLSEAVGSKVKKAGRSVCLTGDQLRVWGPLSRLVMKAAVTAKADSCCLFRRVLLSTHPAQLWHLRPCQTPERWQWMERLREELLRPETNEKPGLQCEEQGRSSATPESA